MEKHSLLGELTAQEKRTLRRLKTLEKDWPERFELQAGGSQRLLVLALNEDGGNYFVDRKGECLDPECVVTGFKIPAQGGDPW